MKKARDFSTVNASSTAFDVGNFVTVNNMFGTPDVSFVAGESTPFKQLALYDTAIVTPGTASGTKIGVARVRTYQHFTGTAGEPDAIYKLFLFDRPRQSYFLCLQFWAAITGFQRPRLGPEGPAPLFY